MDPNKNASPSPPIERRIRTAFTVEQLICLENEFSKNSYIPKKRRSVVSKQTNLPETKIKIWFQNRRMKDKRRLRDRLAQMLADPANNMETNSDSIQPIMAHPIQPSNSLPSMEQPEPVAAPTRTRSCNYLETTKTSPQHTVFERPHFEHKLKKAKLFQPYA